MLCARTGDEWTPSAIQKSRNVSRWQPPTLISFGSPNKRENSAEVWLFSVESVASLQILSAQARELQVSPFWAYEAKTIGRRQIIHINILKYLTVFACGLTKTDWSRERAVYLQCSFAGVGWHEEASAWKMVYYGSWLIFTSNRLVAGAEIFWLPASANCGYQSPSRAASEQAQPVLYEKVTGHTNSAIVWKHVKQCRW